MSSSQRKVDLGFFSADPNLTFALRMLGAEPARVIARRFDLDIERVRLLPAGLLILQAAAELFAAPLRIGLGGIREGVLLEAGSG